MSRVTIVDNALDPSTWETIEDVTNVVEFLQSRYEFFPDTHHIYLNSVAKNCDVTPTGTDEQRAAQAEVLEKTSGHFYIVVYPEGFEVILIIIAIVLAVVAIGLSFLLRPNTSKNQTQGSPNNALGDRQNTARPNERIPDIYGNVISTPDIIAPPYRIFASNQEVEYGYYCIGRKSFQIEQAPALVGGAILWDIKDDITPLQQIDGASAEVYGPNTSPNSGDAPTLTIGASIGQPIVNLQRSSSVIGQIIRPPNDTTITGDNSIRATASGTIECNDSNIDFTDYFATGDDVALVYDGAVDPGGIVATQDLTGFYQLAAVSSTVLTFVSPTSVNPNWANLASFSGAASEFQSPVLAQSGTRWLGPFITDMAEMTEIWCNFVAPNGLFKVSASSGNQYRIDVMVQLEVTPLDSDYNPVGSARLYTTTVTGSAVVQSQRATTLKAVLPLRTDGKPAGRCQVRVQRLTLSDTEWQGQNIDQTQWRDLYAISPLSVTDFGDVTTIQTMSFATASALVTQQRKLNVQVTRLLPMRDPVTFVPSPTLTVATKNAADIYCAMAEDPFIGNRTAAEINYENIYALLGSGGTVETYFGTPLATEFCATFDDSNVSFEEMLGDVSQAVFCQAFRRGSALDISFEQPTDVGTILFNHRNKIPGSETRTVTFGLTNDYDGIEIDYIDPNAPNYPDIDTTVTLYFPLDQSAINAKKITLIGVRNNVQAQLIGWRLYQKLLYQNTVVEFTSLKEAADCVLQDPILVADNTRDDVYDGEIIAVNALLLTLSQPVQIDDGLTRYIFLQLSTGVIEAIQVFATTYPTIVRIASAPSTPLNTDPTTWARTTFMIAIPQGDTGAQRTAQFLLADKKPADKQQYALQAVNYDVRYYNHDRDFINGTLVQNGAGSGSDAPFAGTGGGGSGIGSGAAFTVNTDIITDNPLPTPNPTYNVTTIDVLNGGSGFTSTLGTLSGSTVGTYTSTDKGVTLTLSAGVIIAATANNTAVQWRHPPTLIV